MLYLFYLLFQTFMNMQTFGSHHAETIKRLGPTHRPSAIQNPEKGEIGSFQMFSWIKRVILSVRCLNLPCCIFSCDHMPQRVKGLDHLAELHRPMYTNETWEQAYIKYVVQVLSIYEESCL
jgi:hypothetical protein